MFELEILVYLILKSSYAGSGMNSPYAQTYKYINATIISIGIDWRGGGYDSKNFGTRITWFGVMVENIWTKEVQGAKIGIWKAVGVYMEIYRISSGLEIWFVNFWGTFV
jgi:hypothetical protein